MIIPHIQSRIEFKANIYRGGLRTIMALPSVIMALRHVTMALHHVTMALCRVTMALRRVIMAYVVRWALERNH